eukprot:m.53498 g.53498  ORF g.53498 m.53498 type:complete len:471 (+) comp10869_c0_seq2:49-1461(+)
MSDLAEFLASLSITDVPTTVTALKGLGITTADDLVAVDPSDQAEMQDGLKSGGVNLGDRGKLKKVGKESLEDFRAGAGDATFPEERPMPSTSDLGLQIPDSMDSKTLKAMEEKLLAQAKDKKGFKALWTSLDFNGNGHVSLAELDLFITREYPILNNKKALMRSYKKTTLEDGDGDPYIQQHEFYPLLLNLFYFTKLEGIFAKLDTDGDNRVNFDEFLNGLHLVGFGIKKEEAWREFCKMDDDREGHVLFDEFCHYIAAKMSPEGFEAYYEKRPDIGESARRKTPAGKKVHGRKSGVKGLDKEPDIHTTKYDALEATLLVRVETKSKAKKFFKEIDDNNSGKISKKEFTTYITQHYPLLKDKAMLEYAFRKTTEQGDGDKFVDIDEFPALITNLFYFAKLTFVFSKIDKNHDGRVSFKEFCKSLIWIGLTLSTEDARKEFDSIDCDRGGDNAIDFEEFCDWVGRKKIPVD